LMELNFRRPGIALALGLDETPGLSPLVKSAIGHIAGGDVERAIQRTRVANLFALPNSIDGTQLALPEIEAVKAIVDHVRQSFEYVVIDAAPVLVYPDTALFASLADAVVLIVAADSTPVETGVEARREIERAKAHIVGAVLTRQRRFVPEVLARRLGSTEQ
jgi:Mrp family chromosome partitioning ATPase